MIQANVVRKKKSSVAASSGISKRELELPVREVSGQEPSVEAAPHPCLELRVDQSCSYGGDRGTLITVSCMSCMKRRGLGTQRGTEPNEQDTETVYA